MKYLKINNKLQNKSMFLKELKYNQCKSKVITFLNPFSYNVFLENEELIENFDSFYADGALLVKLHNIFNKNKIDRVSFDFSSIAKDVLEYANNNKLNIALIGAKQKELDGALVNLKNIYPSINFIYTRNGYFNNEYEYVECFKNLKEYDIDILIIGMGSPYQEKFAVKVKNENINLPLIFTCGGFLTQTSIKADYYHPFVKRFGLRWLQRAIMHKHVRNRLIKDYPIFIIKYIYNHILMKLKGEVK
jgi:exopolysaccharide biosynthesis WecB/TagA/CpsF family protein